MVLLVSHPSKFIAKNLPIFGSNSTRVTVECIIYQPFSATSKKCKMYNSATDLTSLLPERLPCDRSNHIFSSTRRMPYPQSRDRHSSVVTATERCKHGRLNHKIVVSRLPRLPSYLRKQARKPLQLISFKWTHVYLQPGTTAFLRMFIGKSLPAFP